ncbi:hypothetical protein O3P69_000939 [Scylla paramamosain]|uniref:Uncharacterized protein n=1 Tax=Scylla paramamosain TaxID=85552 RepID=A0AAW0USE8_SCYPA
MPMVGKAWRTLRVNRFFMGHTLRPVGHEAHAGFCQVIFLYHLDIRSGHSVAAVIECEEQSRKLNKVLGLRRSPSGVRQPLTPTCPLHPLALHPYLAPSYLAA